MALHRTDVVRLGTGRMVRFDVLSASGFIGDTRDAIIALKYANARPNARSLASLLVPILPPGIDVITWAPTSDGRRMSRGIDHAELIARHVAAFSGIPARELLRRVGESRQTGSSREERVGSVAFVARHANRARHGSCVAVVDDVVTTGSTMRAAVLALVEAGHTTVTGLTVASVERTGPCVRGSSASARA